MAYSGHYPACYMPKVLAGSLINFAFNENTRNAHPNVPVPSLPHELFISCRLQCCSESDLNNTFSIQYAMNLVFVAT